MISVLKKLLSEKKSERYLNIIKGVGVFIILFLIVYVLYAFGNILKVDAALEQFYKQFKAYKTGVHNYPSLERRAFLDEQKRGLEAILTRLREYPIFWDRIIKKDVSSMSPLQFKEELFRVKKELKQKAKDKNTVLCHDIGFERWEKKLPEQSELEGLFQALEIVREIGTIAINANINEIEKIMIFPTVEKPYQQNAHSRTNYERDVKIYLNGASLNIVDFLYKVHMSKLLLNIQTMKIYRAAPDTDTIKGTASSDVDKMVKSDSGELLTAIFTIVNTSL
ncbi:MAG: Amuc_1100 family pilus-like protein [Candidatus Omnitrophica bacterium]|nr:Amuc_1100 family pilus-like protein [Candidatus Omnitrophota bacterium]